MTTNKLQSPDDMTPEQIAQALKNIPIIENWITAVKAHAYDYLRDGNVIPGYALGYGVRKRIWKPDTPEETIVAAMIKAGMTRDDLYTKPELISPPKVEEKLRLLKLWPRAKRGQDRPVTPLDGYIEKSMPEQKVIPIDPKQADEAVDRVQDAQREFR